MFKYNLFLLFFGSLVVRNISASILEQNVISKYNDKNSLEAEEFLHQLFADEKPIPDEVDWRNATNRVSEPKNQIGLLEGQLERFNLSIRDLSAQNLIDCSTENDGCFGVEFGSSVEQGIEYVAKYGLNEEISYPYMMREQSCRYQPEKAILKGKVQGYAYLPSNDTMKFKETIAKYGPVVVYMDGSRTEFIEADYYSGIYVDDTCSRDTEKLLHPILVVGYGKDEHVGDYWIVKNSWSWYDWGNDGFLKVASKDNQCGIANKPVIATF